MKKLLALLLVSANLGAVPQSTTLDQVFTKMDQVSKTFKTIETDIKRTKYTLIVKDEDIQSGKFYYMRRGTTPRVKLDIMKPAPDYLLIDNGKLQHYIPAVKQVQEKTLATSESRQVEMIMALGFGQSSQELKSNFNVTIGPDETIEGQKTVVLNLIPKTGSMFRSVQMWLDPLKWISVQTRVVETSGDYMTFRFTNSKLNGNIAESVFKLNLPKGVTVIKL